MNNDLLIMWTIYEKPKDFPDEFIARAFVAAPDGRAYPTIQMKRGKTLNEVRKKLPPGLVCLSRNEGDDPVIVETWL